MTDWDEMISKVKRNTIVWMETLPAFKQASNYKNLNDINSPHFDENPYIDKSDTGILDIVNDVKQNIDVVPCMLMSMLKIMNIGGDTKDIFSYKSKTLENMFTNNLRTCMLANIVSTCENMISASQDDLFNQMSWLFKKYDALSVVRAGNFIFCHITNMDYMNLSERQENNGRTCLLRMMTNSVPVEKLHVFLNENDLLQDEVRTKRLIDHLSSKWGYIFKFTTSLESHIRILKNNTTEATIPHNNLWLLKAVESTAKIYIISQFLSMCPNKEDIMKSSVMSKLSDEFSIFDIVNRNLSELNTFLSEYQSNEFFDLLHHSTKNVFELLKA